MAQKKITNGGVLKTDINLNFDELYIAKTTLVDSVYNAVSESIPNDGITDIFSTLTTLLTTISTNNATIYFGRGTYKLSINIIIPSNVNLKIENGAMFSVDSGVTLTVNGGIEAGLWQVFSGLGAVGGNPLIDTIYPEWFGDGVNSIVKASLLADYSSMILLTSANYTISETIILDNVKLGAHAGNEVEILSTANITMINGLGEFCVENVVLQHNDATNPLCVGISIGSVSRTNNSFILSNIKFGSGLYDCIFSEFECDNSLIEGLQAFVAVGRSVIYLTRNGANPTYAATAGMIIQRNHFSMNNELFEGCNKYGIYFERGDNCSLNNNIANDCGICVNLVEHWAPSITGLHMEERRDIIDTTARWSATLSVSEDDYIRPTVSNANGFVYKAGGNGTTSGSEPTWGQTASATYGDTVIDNDITWTAVDQSKGLVTEEINRGSFNNITPDSHIIAIGTGVATQDVVYNSVYPLGESDYAFFNMTTGSIPSHVFRNSLFNGNLNFIGDSSSMYSLVNCSSLNDDLLGYTLDKKTSYNFNMNGNEINASKKSISSNYTIDFATDKTLHVSTSSGNVTITVPTQTYEGSTCTIIKTTSDTNKVIISGGGRTKASNLYYQRDITTVMCLSNPEYSCVLSKNRKIAKDTTANRPSPEASDIGYTYYDTTLDADGKPIFWNGTKWIDATGTDA